jgi:hypothetical protein
MYIQIHKHTTCTRLQIHKHTTCTGLQIHNHTTWTGLQFTNILHVPDYRYTNILHVPEYSSQTYYMYRTTVHKLKTEDELLCLGRASSSCSTCDTRRVTVKLTRTSSDMEIVLDAVWFIFLLATYCSIAWWHLHKTDVYKTKMLIFFTFFFRIPR